MNSNLIVNFLYELNNKQILLWAQDDALKMFLPEGLQISDEDKKFITGNKLEILNFLRENKIFSKEDIRSIYALNTKIQGLSFAQERLWFIEKFANGTSAYNIPLLLKIARNARIVILEQSINAIVDRHEILRTLVKMDAEGNGYQEIQPMSNHLLQISHFKIDERSVLNEIMHKETNHVYELDKELPIRVNFYELDEDRESYLSIVVHHIAFDGWSLNIFMKEFVAYYNYYLNIADGKDSMLNLSPLTIQYKDFAIWQKNYLKGDRLDKHLDYWKNKLSGFETLNLPLDKVRPNQVDYKGAEVYFTADAETSEGLRRLARDLNLSLYGILLSGFYLLLSKYCNQKDIVVGTPSANRNYTQIADLIGFFVNSMVLRTDVEPNSSVISFIRQVGDVVLEAQMHQDLPFEKLVNELNLDKEQAINPIFQVMFGVQSFGNSQEDDQPLELNVKQQVKDSNELFSNYRIADNYQVAQFDLTVIVDDSQKLLRGSFSYATSLFNRASIESFVSTYQNILMQISRLNKDSSTAISDINYLSSDNYNMIVNIWNKSQNNYPQDKTINELFEQMVKQFPDQVAIIYEDNQLTYKELNQKSEKLAQYLQRKYKLRGDDLVVVSLERSEWIIITILAILKAGAAYVPLDSNYPADRISYVLKDTHSKVILINEIYREKFAEILETSFISNVALEAVDNINLELVNDKVEGAINSDINNKNLAYVIYTSGTTGKPKGVMVEHAQVVSFAMNNNYTKLNSSSKILGYSDYVFDGSIFDIFTTILNGATLHLIKKDYVLNLEKFDELISRYKINHIFTTTALFQHYALLQNNPFLKIENIYFGGEKANTDFIAEFLKLCDNNVTLTHVYGPTENIVFSTYCVLNKDNVRVSPIGKPLNDKKLYILDNQHSLLPIGAIGELYIGGAGVARGYLNSPELTAERFIVNHFQSNEEKLTSDNSRIYKTGDLVRYLPDGNIEYIGRNDFQVKIRGFRIELGEIESALSRIDGIRQSIVIPIDHKTLSGSESGTKYLVGYYVADSELEYESIINYLKSQMPEYMVPAALVYMDKLPLTINGKVDRRALPDPEFKINADNYVAPRNDLEIKVCEIYSEVLGIPIKNIGINDDFFKLGGNSILAIKLISKLSAQASVNISIQDLFKHKTISSYLSVSFQDEGVSYEEEWRF